MNTKKRSKTSELMIRITNSRLRKHLEEEAKRTGRTPAALVNAMYKELTVSSEALEDLRGLYWEAVEQRRRQEKLLQEVETREHQGYEQILAEHKEIVAEWRKGYDKFVELTFKQQNQLKQLLEAFVAAARSWKDSAEKAVALCEKYAVKVGYFNTVRRQRDELLGLVERFLGGQTVRPDEVGEIYAIAHSGLIDRMIDRIEITAPPEVAPFDPDPSLFAAD